MQTHYNSLKISRVNQKS